MKKNVLIKGILVLLVITLLAIGFTGCAPIYIYPTTGTVYITVDTWDNYSIYVDGIYENFIYSYQDLIIYNVPTGYHTFEAYGYYYGYYGYKTQYIYSGNNYVRIYTY